MGANKRRRKPRGQQQDHRRRAAEGSHRLPNRPEGTNHQGGDHYDEEDRRRPIEADEEAADGLQKPDHISAENRASHAAEPAEDGDDQRLGERLTAHSGRDEADGAEQHAGDGGQHRGETERRHVERGNVHPEELRRIMILADGANGATRPAKAQPQPYHKDQQG